MLGRSEIIVEGSCEVMVLKFGGARSIKSAKMIFSKQLGKIRLD